MMSTKQKADTGRAARVDMAVGFILQRYTPVHVPLYRFGMNTILPCIATAIDMALRQGPHADMID